MILPAMPEAEVDHLVATYRKADVILEYGSGGSTQLASQMPRKLVLSVESDREWARRMRNDIDAAAPVAQTIIHHVDIGQTGTWGRPTDLAGWQDYHHYPNQIWDQPFFRHPDVVLIDGRFRLACLVSTMLHITRPVTVLFDDYRDRERYHVIEKLVAPHKMIGRMAEFHLKPDQLARDLIGLAISTFFKVTMHSPTMPLPLANRGTHQPMEPSDA